jgi:hypothetical protein
VKVQAEIGLIETAGCRAAKMTGRLAKPVSGGYTI